MYPDVRFSGGSSGDSLVSVLSAALKVHGKMTVVSADSTGLGEADGRPAEREDDELGRTEARSDNSFPYDDEHTSPSFPYKNEGTGAQIFGSRHFVQIGDWGNPTLTAAVTVLADSYADNIPAAAAAGAAAELAQRYKHLSESEVAVFDLFGRLAQGGSIYTVWIAEDELLEAMDPDLDIDDRRRLLANMKSKGILEEGAGKWRAVW
jgi:hypothetical protein